VHKGDKLYVEGTLRSRSYDDKNGVSRTIVEIYVNNMEMLSRNPQQGAAATTPSATQNPTVASGQSVDQPPF
jgi:single-strand DNA-binding protein